MFQIPIVIHQQLITPAAADGFLCHAMAGKVGRAQDGILPEGIEFLQQSVSYTHLDVYKRQVGGYHEIYDITPGC